MATTENAATENAATENSSEKSSAPSPPVLKDVAKSDYHIQGVKLGFPFVKTSVEKCMNMELHPNDILIVGFPKSGNTWLQDMAWLTNNNADTDEASQSGIMHRVPLIEQAPPNSKPLIDLALEREPPRMMNTHLPFHLFKEAVEKGKPKVLFVVRNPKDVAVSYFHFYNKRPGRINSYPQFGPFYEELIGGKLLFGNWFDHTKGWLNYIQENKDNTLIVTYEGMKADHSGTIEKLASFFGKDLTKEQVETIREFTSFDTMKNRASKGAPRGDVPTGKKEGDDSFFRKGVVGDWKNTITVAQSEEIDFMFKEKLGDCQLKFEGMN